MDATQRRYLDGFSAGLSAREQRRAVSGPPVVEPEGRERTASTPDPWRTLLACAEGDRPPPAGEREALAAALGVVDLAPEGRDGCGLRLRGAPGGRLRAWQLRELADVSQESAGGFIGLGERGGPELAAVGWREAAGALGRLRAAGFAGGDGRVWCSPAAGLDPGEVFDVTGLARTLEAVFSAEAWRVGLDGGARGETTGRAADDLTLRAAGSAGGESVFEVTAGGMRFGVPAARAGSAAVALAEVFRRNGRGWDGLDAEKVREATLDVGWTAAPAVPARTDCGLMPGTFAQRQPGLCALVAAGPADGLWRSRALVALAGLTEEIGTGEARLWPGGVLVPGVAENRAEEGLARLAEIVALVR